ncbi:MAG: helix-turn-helix domain-containing protein [Lentisphaerae bacterium]|nr:helix-turn-helix domain-containing protein [Lentisphaerota bacterium]
MVRESLARELHEIIRTSGIRQNIIAEALGWSSSALSQFCHGTALPLPQQLAALLNLLCVSRSKHVELNRMLAMARDEAGEDLYIDVKAGDNTDEIPDPETPKKPFDHNNFDELFNIYGTDPAKLIFAESPNAGVPIINLEDLDNYSPGINLYEYANIRLHDTTVRDYGEDISPVIMKTTGDMLGLRYPGMVQLVISDDIPPEMSSLVLSRYPDGTFMMLPNSDKYDLCGLEMLFDRTIEKKSSPKWTVAVIEFIIVPLGHPTSLDDKRFL